MTKEENKFLPSGEWEGFYCYPVKNEQHKMTLELHFSKNKITGSGSDDVGNFYWEGIYDLDVFKATLDKYYLKHSINYFGDIDENGIWGYWLNNMSNFPADMTEMITQYQKDNKGGFHIWPKKINHEKNQEKLKESLILKKLMVLK